MTHISPEDIVVGFDGDSSAGPALRWAVDEAKLRGARVRAVYAYIEPVVAEVNLAPPDHALSLDHAQRAAEAWRDEALAGHPHDVEVAVEVRVGPAGPALLDAARDAQLLVVGCREHHPLYRLVHGSVSHYCLAHASCPVVAVPCPGSS